MPAAVALAQAARHRVDDRAFIGGAHVRIAAEGPDHPRIAVALPEEPPIGMRAGRSENLRVAITPVPPPRRQQAHGQPQRIGTRHHMVDMREIGLVGLRRITPDKRQFAIGIGFVQAAQFGQRHCLDHGEPLVRAVPQIDFGLLARQPVKQRPGGIAEVEERLALAGLQVTPAGGDFERGPGVCRRGRTADRGSDPGQHQRRRHRAPYRFRICECRHAVLPAKRATKW